MLSASMSLQQQQQAAFHNKKMEERSSSSSSPCSGNPPSIVSFASDVFDSVGFNNNSTSCDPEQLVPSTLSDLFEGALCDDELNGACVCLTV